MQFTPLSPYSNLYYTLFAAPQPRVRWRGPPICQRLLELGGNHSAKLEIGDEFHWLFVRADEPRRRNIEILSRKSASTRQAGESRTPDTEAKAPYCRIGLHAVQHKLRRNISPANANSRNCRHHWLESYVSPYPEKSVVPQYKCTHSHFS